jgi:hypothetical protein
MKITRVKFYQNVEVGTALPISFASAIPINPNAAVYELSLVDGVGVKVKGTKRTVIVPLNNVAQIDIEEQVVEKAEVKATKKGA